MKFIKPSLVAILCALLALPARAQFVVIDPVAIAAAIEQVVAWGEDVGLQYEQIANQTEQITTAYKQVANQVEQIKKAKEMIDNMTGSRLLGLIRNEIATNDTIPDDVKGMLAGLEVPDQLNQAIKSIATKGLLATSKRGQQIQGLMGDINSTSDPKAIAELTARITAEQANVQNDTNRILLAQAETRARERDLVELEMTFNDSTTSRGQAPLMVWNGQ